MLPIVLAILLIASLAGFAMHVRPGFTTTTWLFLACLACSILLCINAFKPILS